MVFVFSLVLLAVMIITGLVAFYLPLGAAAEKPKSSKKKEKSEKKKESSKSAAKPTYDAFETFSVSKKPVVLLTVEGRSNRIVTVSSDHMLRLSRAADGQKIAQMALPVLRGFHLLAVAAGKEDVLPIGAEGDAVRIMSAPGHLGGLAPDNGEIVDPAAVGQRAGQCAAPKRRAARIAFAGFRPGQVDRPRADGIRAFAG